MRKTLLAAAIMAAALPLSAQAQDAEYGAWSGSGELSYLMKRGNTRSETFSAKGNAERDGEDWRHIAKLEASNIAQRSDAGIDERTAERYFGSYKLDAKIDDANYIFNILSAEKDRYTGFNYEASYALGYGRRVIESDIQVLDIEAGPGYRFREYEQTPPGGDKTEGDAILRLAVRYSWAMTPTATFTEDLSSEIGEDATVTRATTAVTTKISDAWGLRVSHVLRHTTDPGFTKGVKAKKTDQEITVGVVYNF